MGRTLLERVFAQDVDGKVTTTFSPEGMSYRLEIPMTRVQAGAASFDVVAPPPEAGVLDLSALRILVVEDAPLVAQDLALQLMAAGAVVIGPFFRLAEGLAGAAAELDFALIDVDLDNEPVWPLARQLQTRGVPFLLTTGFSSKASWPEGFADCDVIYKPYEIGVLRAAVTRAQTAASRRPKLPTG